MEKLRDDSCSTVKDRISLGHYTFGEKGARRSRGNHMEGESPCKSPPLASMNWYRTSNT